jgi:hypothetical protein
MSVRVRAALAGALLLAGCAAPQTPVRPRPPGAPPLTSATPNVPDFAVKPYEPFSRAAVVAIALREWRLFGQGVDDDPPGTRPPLEDDQKPERQEGLWQRVGEYWYEGMSLDQPQALWTGKHDAYGVEFAWQDDGEYAWSAAFVSYVLRVAGAGDRFPYSPSHDTYIDAAWHEASGDTGNWLVTAHPIDQFAPRAGDLICTSRTARPIRYRDLPASFPAHCDIVVQVAQGSDTVIGGNVDDAVTAKHVPTLPDGRLGDARDRPLDDRYPWFVVLEVSDAQLISSR